MFIGHSLFRISERHTTNHLTAIRISRNYGRFTAFCWSKHILPEQDTESGLLLDATVAGNTFLIQYGLYVGAEINLSYRCEKTITGKDSKRQYGNNEKL